MAPSAPPRPLPLAVAVLVQRRSDGAILVVRRAPHLALGGYWTPVTGRVEPGESLADAAHRELREETGLTAELGPELTRGPTSNGQFAGSLASVSETDTREAFANQFELIYFRALASDPVPPLALQTSEVTDARWLHADALADLTPMLETSRRILREALLTQFPELHDEREAPAPAAPNSSS